MGSGDLNLLKSWNPHLLKNKKKVWETEQQLLDEKRKIEQRQTEIAKEKELEDLTSLNRDGTSSKRKTGLEWMYRDEAARNTENDDFLLGKKKIDASILKNTNEKRNDSTSRKRFDNSSKGLEDLIPKNKPKSIDLSREDPMLKLQMAKKLKSNQPTTNSNTVKLGIHKRSTRVPNSFQKQLSHDTPNTHSTQPNNNNNHGNYKSKTSTETKFDLDY